MILRFTALLAAVILLGSCAPSKPAGPARITVAAAANLTDVFAEVGKEFKAKTGLEVVFSYGSTAQLAKQIENGAPFDLFAAADSEHVDSLVTAKKASDPAVYALGQLALWLPDQGGVHVLKDLSQPQIRFVAIAQPELAPYGQAAVDALKHAGIWETIKPKIVYGGNISQAKQLAASGNADAAFTAYSLVLHERGTVIKVDSGSYKQIEQSLALVGDGTRSSSAKQFRSFLLGSDGRQILSRSGYLLP